MRAIIFRADKLLVEWLEFKSIAFLPGGAVERGEERIEALNRELREELEGAHWEIGRYRGKIGHYWIESSGSNNCLNHFHEVQLSPHSEPSARELGRCLKWIALSDPEAQHLQPPSLLSLLRKATDKVWDEVDHLDRSSDNP